MIKCYVRNESGITLIDTMSDLNEKTIENVIWVDMFTPSYDEIVFVENNFDIKFPTKQETEEIEISSRYWEESDRIEINSFFLVSSAENPHNGDRSKFCVNRVK
ncbi:MAG: hypothetical protein ACYC04_08560 [Sulfurovum sp.]